MLAPDDVTVPIAELVAVIDVDSHILEPPDLWRSRLPAKWQDLAPRVVTDEASGQQGWNIGGRFAIGAATYAAKSTPLFMLGNAACIAELIFGRICHRYPSLKFVSVESGYGFIPYLLEAFDWQFSNSGARFAHPDMLLPSEYFRRQIYSSFWFERHSLNRLIDLYPDNVMFETDYPHATSLSPGDNTQAKSARETIQENLGGLPEDTLA